MNRTKHRLADARLADARLADARLADGVYWFHIIFILVLLLGILWPNPEWCTIMLTLLVMATILYFVFDGCALDKYEQYFRGKTSKDKFVKRAIKGMGIDLSKRGWWYVGACRNALIVALMIGYATIIIGAEKDVNKLVAIATVTAIVTIMFCATAPARRSRRARRSTARAEYQTS
jgi:hypothetical protein